MPKYNEISIPRCLGRSVGAGPTSVSGVVVKLETSGPISGGTCNSIPFVINKCVILPGKGAGH